MVCDAPAMANGALETLRGFTRRWAEPLVIGVFLTAAFGPPLVEHVKNASDHFRFADDVRILMPPLFRSDDPALFPGDAISDYYLAGLPDCFRLLYVLVAPVAGPEALSKILPYLLLAFAISCLGVTAHRLGGKPAVLGAVALALGSPHVFGRMVGGLPRAFALPLLLAGALALALGRPMALAALAVIAAAFYPVAGVLLGLSLFGWFLLPARDRGLAATFSIRRRAVILALTAVGMGLVVLPSALRLRAYGPTIDASLVRDFPEVGEFGRFDPPDRPPFPALPNAAADPLTATLVGDGTPFFSRLNGLSQGTLLAIWVFVTSMFGWSVLARRRAEARRFLVFPAAVVVAHTLSLLLTPHLFLPQRYVAYGLAVVALVGVPTAFSFSLESAHKSLKYVPLAWNVFVLLVLGARGTSWAGLTVLVPPAERPLYASIARLPKTSVVAGWPGQAIDNVPYLSRRTAFVTRETHMPFHRRYTELMRARMRAFVAAYYASDPEPLRALHRQYGVTHLLVDRKHFVEPPPYFLPFDPEARLAFAAGRTKGFELERAIEHGKGSETGGLVLLELSDF
jgi:hypothetical protein